MLESPFLANVALSHDYFGLRVSAVPRTTSRGDPQKSSWVLIPVVLRAGCSLPQRMEGEGKVPLGFRKQIRFSLCFLKLAISRHP